MAHLLCGLFDAHLSVAQVLALRAVATLLVRAAAGTEGTSANSRLDSAGVTVFEAMGEVPGRRGLRVRWTQHPIASLHWPYRDRLHLPSSGLYTRLAPRAHMGLRVLERQMLANEAAFGRRLDRNLYRYALAFRHLCAVGRRHTTDEKWRTVFTRGDTEVDRAFLGTVVDLAGRTWRDEGRWSSRTIECSLARLRVLLGLEAHTIAPKTGGPRSPGQQARSPRVGLVALEEAEDAAGHETDEERVTPVALLVAPPPEAEAEGESAVDYAHVLPTRAQVSPARHQSGPRRGWAGAHAFMAGLGLTHERGVAQPYEFAQVWATSFATPIAAMTPDALGRALAVLLASTYGWSARRIWALRRSSSAPRELTVPHGDIDQGLQLCLPRIAAVPAWTGAPYQASLPGRLYVRVPLTEAVRVVLRRLVAAGEWKIGTALTLVERLCAETPELRLQLDRLARSATRWLVAHGLPRVVMAMISGRFDFGSLATSAYANVSGARLTGLHEDALRRFQADIWAEADHRGWDLLGLKDLGPAMHHAPETTRYGSRRVPAIGAVATTVKALASGHRPVDLESRLPTLAAAWNQRVVYQWLQLLWGTALRPCRDPVVTRGKLDMGGGWLLVEDKASPRGPEPRPVPLPPPVVAGLAWLRLWAPQVHAELRARGVALSGVVEDELFFLIQDGRAHSLTPARVRRELEGGSTDGRYSWPFNAPRHYWITRALDRGEPLDAIEPFLGHLHGPLPWGRYATQPLRDVAEAFRAFGTAVLREAGFVDGG